MPDYAFLIGRPDAKPTFWRDEADEELAYACDWVPLAWLALFEPADVVVIEEPVDAEQDDESPQTCATLIRERNSALEIFRHRSPRLETILPAGLAPQLRALESLVENSVSPYLQVIVTDIDFYISFDSADDLREQTSTMDGDDLDSWRPLLSYVQGRLGSDFSKIELPAGVEVQSVVGYLPEQFAVPYAPPPPPQQSPRAWFTRNAQSAKPWHAFVRPGYVKLLLFLLAAAILLLVSPYA